MSNRSVLHIAVSSILRDVEKLPELINETENMAYSMGAMKMKTCIVGRLQRMKDDIELHPEDTEDLLLEAIQYITEIPIEKDAW